MAEEIKMSLQDQFLEAMLQGELSKFRELLGHPAVNPAYKYGKPHFSTCLEIACRRPNSQDYVKALLTKVKPNINQIVPEPIHFAAGKGNDDVLEVLLRDKRTKVSAEDSYGRTALHHVAKNFGKGEDSERYERCVALLLTQTDLDINRPNKKGCTAIFEAAYYGGKKAVLAMMKYGKEDLDLDSSRGVGKTARDIIIDKYPELKGILPLPKRESISSTEPRCQLVVALQNRYLDIFSGLLHQVDTDGNIVMDPNQWYGKPYNTTCLEMACREEGCEEFVQALLQAEADPNTVNFISEKYPIHIAAEMGNYNALRLLLNDKRTNVNAIDNNGRTALHCALDQKETKDEQIKKWVDCVSILLDHPYINVNIIDNNGHSPILTAVLSGNKKIVKTILFNTHFLDIDTSQGLGSKTVRDVILDNFPDLESQLPQHFHTPVEVPDTMLKLIQYLHKRQSSRFVNTIKEQIENYEQYVNGDVGSHTFLQYACKHGLYEVAEVLLDHGANPNKILENSKWPPVVLSCYHRHHNILKLFLNLSAKSNFNINAKDKKGNTALHYAAKFEDLNSVLALLSHGADIRTKNVFDKPPLPSKAVESLLNKCLRSDGKHYPEEDEYKLMFNYGMLVPHRGRCDSEPLEPESVPLTDFKDAESNKDDRGIANISAEMDFLFYLSQSSEHTCLLQHPIITSFLHLKWHRIRGFFFLNLAFYILFVLSLNLNILLGYGEQGNQNDTKSTMTISDEINNTNTTVDPMNNIMSASPSISSKILGIMLSFLLVFLGLREFLQLLMSPKQYIRNPENILDVSLIIFTCLSLYTHLSSDYRSTITVITILLSWTELVLLSGRFPKLSRNIEMLKTVSWTFFRFMIWYSLLIMAFAISFYTMFHSDKRDEFKSIEKSMFKTIIMMTGEFDSGSSIPFDAVPYVTSRIVFVLFVFLIAIVLLNLLTGLAVSDTQAIQNNAELLSLISRIRLVFEVESMLIQWHRTMSRIPHIKPLMVSFEKWIKSITLFPASVPDKHFCVLPNKGADIISPHDDVSMDCKMDQDTLGAAMNIIGQQSRTNDMDLIKKQMENIEKLENRNKEALDQVLELLISTNLNHKGKW